MSENLNRAEDEENSSPESKKEVKEPVSTASKPNEPEKSSELKQSEPADGGTGSQAVVKETAE
jgi:hypothetical protein